jgi:hypothetical protein
MIQEAVPNLEKDLEGETEKEKNYGSRSLSTPSFPTYDPPMVEAFRCSLFFSLESGRGKQRERIEGGREKQFVLSSCPMLFPTFALRRNGGVVVGSCGCVCVCLLKRRYLIFFSRPRLW